MKLNVKDMKKEELESKLAEMKKELMKVKTKIAGGTPPAKGQGNVRNIKKNIARIKTRLTEVNKKE